jgi:type II secretory pathway pseudopilin PulG
MSAPRRRQGFTLLEVMVASSIFMITLSSVVAVAVIAIKRLADQNAAGEAVSILQGYMEENDLRPLRDPLLEDTTANVDPWDDDPSDCDHPVMNACHTSVLSRHTALGQQKDDGRYVIWWDVVDDFPVPGLKTVVYHARWGDAGARRHIYFASIKGS